MGEVSRRTGRPVSVRPDPVGPTPDAVRRCDGDCATTENERGAMVRPQTTARGIGILFGLHNRTPFDRGPAWKAAAPLSLDQRLAVLRDPQRRARWSTR